MLINKINIRDNKELDQVETSGKRETIEGIEVSKYSYTLHTMEKLETIKKPNDWKK